ncbi:DUF397 domain-containing protein [Nocardia jinanensis]|nr:DUF397 domain-containing protein [Nocardia jinanensis]
MKSSRSYAARECVEVAWLDAGNVGVRAPKCSPGPALVLTEYRPRDRR